MRNLTCMLVLEVKEGSLKLWGETNFYAIHLSLSCFAQA